ncbi:hypothetical protein TNCV_3315281 [Trichonephila clavipes]|nr:hypothetical protein TNCV_3315281 [Trichonephila clavipes]
MSAPFGYCQMMRKHLFKLFQDEGIAREGRLCFQNHPMKLSFDSSQMPVLHCYVRTYVGSMAHFVISDLRARSRLESIDFLDAKIIVMSVM